MFDIFSFLQSELIKYVQIISEVLKVDIQVIDAQFNRIAGTGYWKDKINENVKDSAYVTHARGRRYCFLKWNLLELL